MPPAPSQNEIDAAKGVRSYGKYSLLLYVIGVIAFVAVYIFAIFASLSSPSLGYQPYQPSPISPFAAIGGTLWLLLVFVVILLAIGIIALFSIHQAFAAMAKDDAQKFSRPLMMVRVGIAMPVIGAVLIGLAFFASSGALGLMGILLLAIGALILFWGIAIGLWRFGSEYENAILKVGAILAAFGGFPGMIFIYLGACEICDELKVPK